MSRIIRRFKSACAWMMVLVMAMTSVGVIPVQAESENEESAYRDELFERYEAYRDGNYSYSGLIDDSAYLASFWAAIIEEKTTDKALTGGYSGNILKNFVDFSSRLDDNFVAEWKALNTWAGQKLTDTSLDQEAYVEYLSKIVAMHGQGFLKTAGAQAEYTIRVNAGEEMAEICETLLFTVISETGKIDFTTDGSNVSKITKVKWKYFLDEETLKILQEYMEGYDLAEDFVKAIDAEIELTQSVNEVCVLAVDISLQSEQLKFLNAIYENADEKEHKKLKKAAKALLDASCMELGSLMYMETADEFFQFFSAVYDVAKTASGVDLWPCLENLMAHKAETTAQLITEIGEKTGSLEKGATAAAAKNAAAAAGSAVKILSKVVSAAGYAGIGVKIGSTIGRICLGDDYELVREMLIMDEVSGVLSEAVSKYNEDYETAKAQGDDEARYDAVYSLVAAAEALCYTRLAGEYAYCEFAKGKKDSPEDEVLDNWYEEITDWLYQDYLALSTVFPRSKDQVTVYENCQFSRETNEEDTLYLEIADPEVMIEGNEEAAEKINANQDIQEYHNQLSGAVDLSACSGNGITEELHVFLMLKDAAVAGQCLSMMLFSGSYYYGAATMTYPVCHTFDLQSGEVLTLNDILEEDENGDTQNAMEALASVLTEQFSASEEGQASLSYLGFTDENISTEKIFRQEFLEAEEDMRERHWYLSEEGFTVMFDKYQIAFGAAGVVQFTVPWEQLTDIIKSKYQPETVEAAVWGIPELCQKSDTSNITVSEADLNLYGSSSQSFWIGYTTETAYEVKLTSGLEELVFYANIMTPNDVVCLQDSAGFDTDPYTGGTISCLTGGNRFTLGYGNSQT